VIRAFEQFILERSSGEFIERDWLKARIDRVLAAPDVNLVLITGEPGTGKTSLMAGMAKAHPDWLRYFVGGETGGTPATGDLSSFLLAIGHQLAHQQPMLFEPSVLEVAVQQHVDSIEAQGSATGIRIEDLHASPFYRTARLTVEQQVGNLGGTLTGVEIGTAHLEPRLLEPDNLAHLALLGPAGVLSETDPEGPGIVILLDALDEASRADRDSELLEWLATGPRLPDNVKIVVTSRPQSALGLLRAKRARDGQMEEIVLDPDDRHVTDDLIAYAERTLATTDIVSEAEARKLFPGEFTRHVARRAGGNFLYLASYERALKDAVDSRDVKLMDQLFRLEDLPETLSGIYGFFVELARVEIDRLGLLNIENPLIPDERTPAWEGVGQPLLGVLAVAREPLTEDQLVKLAGTRVWQSSVLNVLARLRWFLYRRGGRVALFHASVGEFLTGTLARDEHPDCWLDPVEWNERVARHYNPRIARPRQNSAATWAEVEWAKMDRYGLTHLSEHVLKAKPSTSNQAVGLICNGFFQAAKAEFGVARQFLDAVDQIAHNIIQDSSVKNGLSRLIYLGVVRNHASRVSRAVPARVLGLMARAGRLNEALQRAAELTSSNAQFRAIAEIAHHAECGPGTPAREALNEHVIEYAFNVLRTEGRTYGVRYGLERAAETIAPYNLDRVLGLWRRAREGSPDSLYRSAAAAESDPARARVLIGKLGKDRWRAYLDLAGRVTEPALAGDILMDAERNLADGAPTDRVRGFAELAKIWHALDRGKAARFTAELRAEVFQAGEAKDLPQALVDAAYAIESVDAATARMLLTRLDLTSLDPDPNSVYPHSLSGIAKATLIRAAVLWTNWGEPARVRSISSRMPDHDRWGQFWLRSALGELSREAALETLEEILAATEYKDAAPDSPEGGLRAMQLVPLADAFAVHDLKRAAEVARQMPLTSWIWGGSQPSLRPLLKELDCAGGQPEEIYAGDRYSMLSWIAHRHLDCGERTEAMELLEEALAFHAGNADLEPSDNTGPMSPSQPGAAEARTQGSAALKGPTLREMVGDTTDFEVSQDWQRFVRLHFFRRPADVVRAVAPRSGSLAKTLRVTAQQLWIRDRATATRVIEALEDAGERAIGLSVLHVKSHDPDHGRESERLSRELDEALAELPSPHSTSSHGLAAALAGLSGRISENGRWLSLIQDYYRRPDIRVRFEVATVTLGCRQQDARAIEEYRYLSEASKRHLYVYLVEAFTEALLENGPAAWAQHARKLIEEGLSPEGFAGQQGDPLIDSARAAIAYQEYRITRRLPGYAPVRNRVWIDDPIYATAVDLTTPARGGVLSPAFAEGIRNLLTDERPAAAAALLAFAAEVRPESEHTLRGLAQETVRAARALDPAARIEALSHLASAPALAEVLDLAELFNEAERAAPAADSDIDLVQAAIIRLFPALLQRSPSVAMSAFYQAVSTQWSRSMSFLESVSGELLQLFGPQFAEQIARPVQQGLACVSADGAAPPTACRVSFTRLLPEHPEET
jgi:hypothetical protein